MNMLIVCVCFVCVCVCVCVRGSVARRCKGRFQGCEEGVDVLRVCVCVLCVCVLLVGDAEGCEECVCM